MAEALSHCAAAVRRADHDRFLLTLFAPAAARERLFALYAFNHEIAKVRESVSEPMLGQIRLQWWREAVDGIYAGRLREHPVVRALAEAVRAGGLGRAALDRIIDTREFDLAGRAPASLAELEAYCEGTSSSLLALAAEALGARASTEPLRPLGVAWALTGLLRAVPFHARARRQFIPADIAADAGLGEETLFALKRVPELAAAARRLAAVAEERLVAARGLAGAVEPAARPLLLYAALADAYLRRLKRSGYDVLGRTDIPRPFKILTLWRAARRIGA